eukprot:CAMPEP_0202750326 /NCGR_PEP_ID=MMETSP1388-20130828/11233_1 /ASSEMBLY_ACC=CAM_ASM_000864 /TAXON_ID=37098 /ORGANISM="Isochrysis sp, Strain CCMP1244" /LENGTH=273 /DNA_ID=CAMNT_0049417899 /DNA_START=205 /DNA_END=1023 /DNA_ORIENTATION=+
MRGPRNIVTPAWQRGDSPSRPPDDLVVVERDEDEVASVELHLVGRHAPCAPLLGRVPVQLRDDPPLCPLVRGDLALDVGPDLEAERRAPLRVELRGGEAGAEAGAQLLVLQVLADEDEPRLARLALGPLAAERAVEDHVHALEDALLRAARDGEDALSAEDVGAPVAQQVSDPSLEQLGVDLARLDDGERADRRVVLVLRVRVEEAVVHLERALQVEGAQLEHVADGHLRLLAALDGRKRVDGAQPPLHPRELRLVDQVHLVEQQPVREGDLL